MTSGTVVNGVIDHGSIYTYVDNAKHQPYDNIYAAVYSAPNPGYLLQTVPLPALTPDPPGTGYYRIPKTVTIFACYKLALQTQEGKDGAYPFYIRSPAITEHSVNSPQINYGLPQITPQEANPGGDGTRGVGGDGRDLGFTRGDEYFPYLYRSYISEWYLFQNVELTFTNYRKPYYADLIGGYFLDTRSNPQIEPTVMPTITEEVTIGYYRQNRSEPLGQFLYEPNLISLDWMIYKVNLIKGQLNHLPIKDCMFGSLYVIDGTNQILDLISGLPTIGNTYSYAYCINGSIPGLFGEWNAINTSRDIVLPPNFTESSRSLNTEISRELNVIYANNDCWNNDSFVGTDANIERFPVIDDQKAFGWHLRPQADGSFGDLVMNSPLLEDIGRAIDAAKWGVNPDDPTLPRVDNLGWRINRLCDITGIRVKPDGSIDVPAQKNLVRQVIDKNKNLDSKKYGVSTFGELGMAIKRITNRFKGKNEIASDQCVIIQDIPQMIQEYFEQINLALGIQESSAIEIKQGDNTARFNSQLEILIELVNLMSSGNEMVRATLVSSLVAQSQSSEIIAGLGLPSVTKTIPIKIDKKVSQLPFKGIAPHRSISQEIATCTYNVGIALGQLL